MSWQPTACFNALKARALLYDRIRLFFKDRGICEVETPLLSRYTVTDPHIDSFKVGSAYLQTSPEYAMKRLLAAGSGPIFQIAKAFRQGELGNRHNLEFTLLEWYRPGFTYHELMDEVGALLSRVTVFDRAQRLTYRDVFQQYLGLDPFEADDGSIKALLENMEVRSLDRDTCLQLLLSERIEPHLGIDSPLFVYDFPPSQAALACVRQGDCPVAERFELFIHGMEIANGFNELTDTDEQEQRFKRDQAYRVLQQKDVPDLDPRLIAALKAGLPSCAGVALGVDRLLMCIMGRAHIKEVLSFDAVHA